MILKKSTWLMLMFILLLILGRAHGQKIQRMVQSSMGAVNSQLNFTIGQPAAGIHLDSSFSIGMGFQQPLQYELDTSIAVPALNNICGSAPFKLEAGKAPYYQWFKDNVIITGAISRVYYAKESGLYKVILFDGIKKYDSSRKVSVQFRTLPSAKISIPGPDTVCAGTKILILAERANGYTYQWKKYGVNIEGGNAFNYYATTTGVYSVLVKNSYGCSAVSQPVVVKINDIPIVNISVSGPTTFCGGSSVLLRTNWNHGYAYQWKKSGNIIPGAISYQYTANTSGNYSVEINSASGCSATSTAAKVIVNALPAATVFYTGLPVINKGDSILLRANISNDYSYQWQKNGAIILSAKADKYYATVAGSYSVTVKNSFGCSAQSQVVQVSNTAPLISAGDNSRTKAIFDIPKGETIKLYPNPLSSVDILKVLTGNIGRYAKVTYLVTDISGRHLKSGKLDAKEQAINIPLERGFYFVEIIFSSTDRKIFRVIRN